MTRVVGKVGFSYGDPVSVPVAILIAGANGSGKTTFARQVLPLLHPEASFINADEIQRQGGEFTSDLAASRIYLPRIARWRALGYRTVLHFIEVPSADFAVQRVQQRVQNGGHDIPEADIRRRFARGRDLFDGVYKGAVHEWHHWTTDDQGLRRSAHESRNDA